MELIRSKHGKLTGLLANLRAGESVCTHRPEKQSLSMTR